MSQDSRVHELMRVHTRVHGEEVRSNLAVSLAADASGYFSSLVGMEFLNVRELSVRMKLEHGLARECPYVWHSDLVFSWHVWGGWCPP